MKEKKKPNFFIIGHMKTGTTAMYEYFKPHPEVFVPRIKELSYFAQEFFEKRWKDQGEEFLNHFLKDERGYLYFFKHANRKETILLDASPNYLCSKTAAEKIRAFNPEAKILVIFREPVSFMRSLHSGMLFDLAEEERDFFKAVELGEKREKHGAFEYILYDYQADYKRHFKRFTNLFPKEQIKVMFYEQIYSDKEKYFKEITEFLKISPMPPVEYKRVNENKTLRFGGLVKKIGRKPKIYMAIKKHMSHGLFLRLFVIYSQLAYKTEKRKELDAEKMNELKMKYKNRVEKFEKFLKDNDLIDQELDLIKLWGYDVL